MHDYIYKFSKICKLHFPILYSPHPLYISFQCCILFMIKNVHFKLYILVVVILIPILINESTLILIKNVLTNLSWFYFFFQYYHYIRVLTYFHVSAKYHIYNCHTCCWSILCNRYLWYIFCHALCNKNIEIIEGN